MKIRTLVSRVAPPLLPLITWIVLMEFLVRRNVVPAFIIPAPLDVLRTFVDEWEILSPAIYSTFTCAVTGLLLSFIVGFSAAILLNLSPFLKRALYPYATFFQTVPIVSLAPVLVIWFGFGRPTVIASAFICSLFPIIASTLLGLQSTEPTFLDLFRLYGSSRFRTLISCRIPSALPQIFSGLRISSGLAVIGAIIGEFIGGGGLGSLVEAARAQQRMEQIFAAVIASALLGIALISAVNLLSRLFLGRWHASERKDLST